MGLLCLLAAGQLQQILTAADAGAGRRHYGLKASVVLSEQPVGQHVLPLMMLLRSQVTILFW